VTEEKVIEKALDLSNLVEEIGYRQYHKSDLPNHADHLITGICEFTKTIDNNQRREFISLLDDQTMWMLFSFSTRMSMLCVREKSTDHLLNGLAALLLVTREGNYHSVLGRISLFYHSAALMKVNPRKLFTAACQYAPSEYARNLFLQFLDRSPVDQIIAAFAAKEVQGPKGLAYQFGNRPIPDGWL
jgi:hypothetical protein